MKRIGMVVLVLSLLLSMVGCEKDNPTLNSEKTALPEHNENVNDENDNGNAENNVISAQNYAIYLKDNRLVFNDLNGKTIDIPSQIMTDHLQFVYYYTAVTSDGCKIFYGDTILPFEGHVEPFDVYCIDTADPENGNVPVCSDVTSYFINDSGTRLAYSTENALYMGSVENPIKAMDVNGSNCLFAINADIDSMIYYEKDEFKSTGNIHMSAVYLWKDGKTQKICTGNIYDLCIMDSKVNNPNKGFSSMLPAYNDITQVCYINNGELYIQTIGEEPIKIDYDVTDIEYVPESGDIYYLKKGERLYYTDYFINDIEVQFNDYQKEVGITAKTLYCYSNGEKNIIVENYLRSRFAENKQRAIIYYFKPDDAPKVRLSNAEGFNEARRLFETGLDKTISCCIWSNGIKKEIELKNTIDCEVNYDGSRMYFLCGNGNKSDYNEGTIYTVSIKNEQISTPERYDESVFCYDISIVGADENLMYGKNASKDMDIIDVYFDQQMLASHVFRYGDLSFMDDGSILYIAAVDYEDDGCYFALKCVKTGKTKTIAENVYYYIVTPDNRVLYIKDGGELYCYQNGKSEKIDDGVSMVFDFYAGNSAVYWEEDIMKAYIRYSSYNGDYEGSYDGYSEDEDD